MAATTSPPRAKLSHLELVQAAVLAPSPDNNQPWRFSSRGDQLLIYPDWRRQLPSDAANMFGMLALGTAVENACIAGRHAGYEAHVEVPAGDDIRLEDNSQQPAVVMTFAQGATSDPLHAHLKRRVTSRKMFSRESLPADVLQRASAAVTGFGGVRWHWLDGPTRLRGLARLVARCDRIRLEHRPFHQELYRQLRFTQAEVEQTRDGLDARTLELPPGGAAMLRSLSKWSRMRLLNRLGLSRLLSLPSARAVRHSAAVGVLTVRQPSVTQFVAAGRAMQRVWLTSEAEGLSLQPLGSLPIFAAHLRHNAGRDLLPMHVRRVEQLMMQFHTLVPQSNGRVLVMLVRVGYAPRPVQRSLRRPVDDVLVAESEPAASSAVNDRSNPDEFPSENRGVVAGSE